MKVFRVFLSVVLFFSISTAQESLSSLTPESIGALQKIQDAALKSDYALTQTRYLTNNIGPRLSGAAQYDRAAQYVAEQMRLLGLKVNLQKVKVPHWVRGVETGEIIEFPGMAAGTTQKIVLTALGGSIATPDTGLVAEVLVVNSFADLEKLGKNAVSGKIVLFNNKFDREMADSGFGGDAYRKAVVYRSYGPSAAARLGAVAALARSAGGSQNRLAHTGALRYSSEYLKIPAAAVSNEDADLLAYLASEGKVRIRLTLTPKTLPDAEAFNVIADLIGSEKPDEIVIVSGHLDSWDLGTGALDDAVGVATAMQVPYLLKKLGIMPKRTIRFIAYANEENGLAGGNGYAEAEKVNMSNHFAAIESDLGASNTVGFLFSGRERAISLFSPISEVLSRQGAGIVRWQEGGVAADIGPLTARGVPSFAPLFDTRTYFNYHHTAADTFDKVEPENLAKLGSLMAVLAYGLANLEVPIPR
ncbi:MAG: hypothetical protein C4325_02645 [Blastocatellia bacterium]